MIARIAAPRLATMPLARALVRNLPGRLVLVAVFTVLLGVLRVEPWWQIGVVLALTSLFPERRQSVLVIAALYWIYQVPPLQTDVLAAAAPGHAAEQWLSFGPVAVALVWLFALAYVSLARRFPASPIGRRPVLGLIAVLGALLVAQARLSGLGWVLVAASALVLGSYLWFFGYWIADRSAKQRGAADIPVGYCRPFWGFTNVPIGKGAAYLRRVEAHSDDELAAVQLKGLQLLIWVGLLKLVSLVSREVLWGSGPFSLNGIVPSYEIAFEHHMQGFPDPLPLRWLAVVLHFLYDILGLTIMGHEIVAVCRMAGFDAFRNTYRPLTSPTIAEFYNRIYYYFKELLATFFFYPTYLRYFKRHPRVRLFTATLAAAGFGNLLFHFLRDAGEVVRLGMWDALFAYHVYAIYALVLGVAIGLSQARVRNRRPRELAGWRKARAIAGVLSFYCIMSMFDVPSQAYTILDYGSFFLSLFWP